MSRHYIPFETRLQAPELLVGSDCGKIAMIGNYKKLTELIAQ